MVGFVFSSDRFREKRIFRARFHRIHLIEHVRRNRWKAKWIDPNAGLVDFVTTTQIVVPWREQKIYLKEEADRERLVEHNRQHGYEGESSLEMAVGLVFENVGEEVRMTAGFSLDLSNNCSESKTGPAPLRI
jgi:hypothetical protein